MALGFSTVICIWEVRAHGDTSSHVAGEQQAACFSISAHSQGKSRPGACLGPHYRGGGGVRPQVTADPPVSVVCPDMRDTEPQHSPVLCWEAGKATARSHHWISFALLPGGQGSPVTVTPHSEARLACGYSSRESVVPWLHTYQGLLQLFWCSHQSRCWYSVWGCWNQMFY